MGITLTHTVLIPSAFIYTMVMVFTLHATQMYFKDYIALVHIHKHGITIVPCPKNMMIPRYFFAFSIII